MELVGGNEEQTRVIAAVDNEGRVVFSIILQASRLGRDDFHKVEDDIWLSVAAAFNRPGYMVCRGVAKSLSELIVRYPQLFEPRERE